MEFEAVDEGIVGKILVAEGTEGVKVNTPIAVLVEEGEERRRRRGRGSRTPPREATARPRPPASRRRAARRTRRPSRTEPGSRPGLVPKAPR